MSYVMQHGRGWTDSEQFDVPANTRQAGSRSRGEDRARRSGIVAQDDRTRADERAECSREAANHFWTEFLTDDSPKPGDTEDRRLHKLVL